MRLLKHSAWVVSIVFLAACSSGPKQAKGPTVIASSPPAPQRTLPTKITQNTRYIVELSEEPAGFDGISSQALSAQQEVFTQQAKAMGVEVLQAYNTAINGFAVTYSGTAGHLFTLPGVVGVYPVQLYSVPKTTVVSPDLASAIGQTGADIAQNDLGLTGRGIKVGVIDSGIDLQHPAFAGRVPYGWDFVGDAYDADPSSPTYDPVPNPDNNPDDCQGHGTHVAGIVGGKDATITGVAPEVTFGAYRVFGCEGSVDDVVVMAALDRAARDRMDIVNLSLGSPYGWSAIGRAMSRMVQRGMVIVASAGNEGRFGLFATGTPGASSDVISVASFDNTKKPAKRLLIDGAQEIEYFALGGAGIAPNSGTTDPISYVGQGCGSDTYLSDTSGKVALIDRGTCTFNEKYQRAVLEGATGVIIANNRPGEASGLGGISPGTVFGIAIGQNEGNILKSLVGSTITWLPSTLVNNPNSDLISESSSWGLSQDLQFKPNLGAPGGYIHSSIPLEKGGYAVFSGTSMSSPHVAGAAALLLQGNPTLRWNWNKAKTVATMLENTAIPHDFYAAPGSGIVESTAREGSGMIDVVGAVQTRVVTEPAQISFAATAGPSYQTITLRNFDFKRHSFTLSHLPTVTALTDGPGSIYTPDFSDDAATVSFDQSVVTVPAFGEARVRVTITPPTTLPNRSLFGGHIFFNPTDGGVRLNVPYAGLQGGYQAIKVLTDGGYGFPWLTDLNLTEYPSGKTFTLEGADYPTLVFNLEHSAQKLQVIILNAANERPIDPYFNKAENSPYQYSNSAGTNNGFSYFVWDGTVITKYENSEFYGTPVQLPKALKDIPDGAYKLQIRALKPTGNEFKPSDWETWTSPVVTIDRP